MPQPELMDLLLELRLAVGVPLHVQPSPESGVLTLQVGDNPDAVLGIRLCNVQPASYSVSYPALSIKRNGDRTAGCRQADGVVREGVVWIIRQLADHGLVRPEYSD